MCVCVYLYEYCRHMLYQNIFSHSVSSPMIWYYLTSYYIVLYDIMYIAWLHRIRSYCIMLWFWEHADSADSVAGMLVDYIWGNAWKHQRGGKHSKTPQMSLVSMCIQSVATQFAARTHWLASKLLPRPLTSIHVHSRHRLIQELIASLRPPIKTTAQLPMLVPANAAQSQSPIARKSFPTKDQR